VFVRTTSETEVLPESHLLRRPLPGGDIRVTLCQMNSVMRRAWLRSSAALLTTAFVIVGRAQAPPPQGGGRTASQAPPPTAIPQSYPAEQVEAGRPLFASQCGFCHGRDAAGGESGPDLTRSVVTAEDNRGDKIGPVVRSGRVDKGMPAFNLPDAEMTAIVAFIHEQKRLAELQQGSRRTVDVADLQTGNAEAGRTYFNGAGGCARCHAPGGDLVGIATRFEGLKLLQRMLYPEPAADDGRRGRARATATVTLPSGERLTGALAYRDEFTIALRDSSGRYRSWPTSQVQFSVDNLLDAHVEQLGKYSDDDMHNVLAYLQTLR
jgi:cytochrome c oxidase cbb3-type subunit III